jgi:predicted NUDIX family phosphoesterase
MNAVATEQVLVIPTHVFHSMGYFQGFAADRLPRWEELISGPDATYQPRGRMEVDPSFKQLIPYVIFRHVDVMGNVSVFKYRRGSGQGESRLHSKLSIGVGGHISRDDHRDSGWRTYSEALRRELDEEVEIATDFASQLIGMINDDETDVGRVHLGVVHLYDVVHPLITPREDEMHDASFATLDQLCQLRDEMESWSRICFDAIFAPK